MNCGRRKAFILTGSFPVICRNALYLRELSDRGLATLLMTPASWRDRALACIADPAHPASAVADVAFVDGAADREGSFNAGVIAKVAQWRDTYDIVGAYAVGEMLAEPTGLVTDGLGLATPGLRATRACRSKYLQRWYMPQCSPASIVLAPGARAALTREAVELPAVVKPASRHSSSGVVTVDDWSELRRELAAYPDHETILVETKVVGREFSVESLVQAGVVLFASVTSKGTTADADSRTFVELSHTVPSESDGVQDALLQANRELLAGLAFEDGIAHAEWRVDGEGRPFLMEVAARTPGDGLMVLYELATGAAMEPQIIRIALGEQASYPAPRRHARQVYLEHDPGVLDDVVVDWPGVEPHWIDENGLWPDIEPGGADDPPQLRAVLVLKERGSTLGSLYSSDDRAVTFFIDAPTARELDELERCVRGAVTMRIYPQLDHAAAG